MTKWPPLGRYHQDEPTISNTSPDQEGPTMAVTDAQFAALTERVNWLYQQTGTPEEPPVVTPPPVGPTPPASLNLVAKSGSSAGSAVISWTLDPAKTVAALTSGRNGKDTSGAGPWSTAEAKTATSREFDKLIVGTAYTFTVTADYSDGTEATAIVTYTPTAGTTTPPPVTTPPGTTSAIGSGVGFMSDDTAAMMGQYKTIMGKPIPHVATFTSRGTSTDLTDNNAATPWWADGIPAGTRLHLAVPICNDNGDLTADISPALAVVARQAAAIDPHAVIRLGWEYNLPSWAWKATDANLPTWQTAWRRGCAAMKAVAPGLIIGQCANIGANQSGLSGDPTRVFVNEADFIGFDSYDGYPAMTNTANINTQVNGKYYWEWWASQALTLNRPLFVGEWGVANSAWGGIGDDPVFVSQFAAFKARSIARGVVWLGDSYFNEPASYIASDIMRPPGVTVSNPKTAANYKTLFSV